MSIAAGTYRLGPRNGVLSVRTERTGAAAKAGHNLLIHVTSWEATMRVGEDPADTTIALEADAASLRVHEGTGGIQALDDDDKAGIEQVIDEEILRGRPVAFRSTRVRPAAGGGGFQVEGDLTLVGTTRPIAFDLAVADGGTLRVATVVRQSDWGIKPYSTLFGTLKVVDEIEVRIEAAPQSR